MTSDLPDLNGHWMWLDMEERTALASLLRHSGNARVGDGGFDYGEELAGMQYEAFYQPGRAHEHVMAVWERHEAAVSERYEENASFFGIADRVENTGILDLSNDVVALTVADAITDSGWDWDPTDVPDELRRVVDAHRTARETASRQPGPTTVSESTAVAESAPSLRDLSFPTAATAATAATPQTPATHHPFRPPTGPTRDLSR